MTTDLVEKCARAAKPYLPRSEANARLAVLAVIDALADGVSDEMVQAFRAQWANSVSKHGKTIDAVCARALSAAIRAAKSREGNGNG